MAKHVILEGYAFTPSTRTVVLNNKFIRQEQIVLITNVSTNTVIYNFADPALTASNYTISTARNVERTTIVLTYDTTTMSSTDKLSIIVDETFDQIRGSETLTDPVGKLRVSEPQSLIDTDFEYSTQSTKWESLNLLNNRSSAFYDVTSPITFTGITSASGTRLVTVSVPSTTGITVGTPVFVQDTTDFNANGWYLVENVVTNTNFTFYAKAVIPAGSIFDSSKTYIWTGTFYTGAGITVSASAGAAFTNVGTVVTCTTTHNHGLSIGDAFFVVGTTCSSNAPNGSWFVRQTPNSNTFIFDVINAPNGTITATGGATATLYARPWGSIIHRPYDGGVSFTPGTPYHGNQLIRQTRRYFRYQSGKGIQFSTGSNMCAPYQLDNLTASGTTATITTKFPHNLWVGATVQIIDAVETAYNGTWTIATVPSDITFTVTLNTTPTSSIATGSYEITAKNWWGAGVKVGLFDHQNGFFFQYDGQNLSVNKRDSTFQLAGYISNLTKGSCVATGISSKWSTQLNPGSNIVIRGMTYTVLSIISDTSMVIYPEYRGTSLASPTKCIITRTDVVTVNQSDFNIDKIDGTGESGYNFDITKMQMWYIDYSWYGAGAIRFGFKNQRGEVFYCHRMAHANNETKAYMRSGNIAARYEVNTLTPITKLTATLNSSETGTAFVGSTTGFPPSGYAVITASGNTGAAIEYVSYSGKTSTTLTGLVRGLQNLTGPAGLTNGGGTTATTFTYSPTAPVSVSIYSPLSSNIISHWGSAVIMDGKYDDDKSIVFAAGQQSAITNINPGATVPLLTIRIAPSVDNGITGILGQRDLINRMQLTLRTMSLFTTGTNCAFFITLKLNGSLSGGTFAAQGGSSLAQTAYHNGSQTITGGENVYGFYAGPGVHDEDLYLVRDLGNSILGGGDSLTVPGGSGNNRYPDGPDILTVCATNVTAVATNSINARISWSEAQA
jgi:hypothetical protein